MISVQTALASCIDPVPNCPLLPLPQAYILSRKPLFTRLSPKLAAPRQGVRCDNHAVLVAHGHHPNSAAAHTRLQWRWKPT